MYREHQNSVTETGIVILPFHLSVFLCLSLSVSLSLPLSVSVSLLVSVFPLSLPNNAMH